MIRQPIITLVGHIDHGKSSLLDKIRGTAIVSTEAGGITQGISCSSISLPAIQQFCGPLLETLKLELKIPGLLFIDTPGHAVFTSLRKRGGSLADLAVLVVDINEGVKPQTMESIEILRNNKVPFVVAANKIDLIPGWSHDIHKFLIENINGLDFSIQGEFEKRLYSLAEKLQELGFPSERFDRLTDYTKQLAIIPVSAKTGQGLPELLMVLTGLAQRFLEKQLEIEEESPAKGTIVEVKEEKGLGMTIDAIIYNGHLKINDTLVIGGIEEPFSVKIRALLKPEESDLNCGKKEKLVQVKEVFAAAGVKIVAPGLEKAIAGMPLRGSTENPANIEELKQELQGEVKDLIIEDTGQEGVIIKSDTLGGLEALRNLLQEKNIAISSSSLGDITKRDLAKVESMKEQNPSYAVIIAFNVNLALEIAAYARAKGLKIINHPIIYSILEEYENYTQQLRRDTDLKELATLIYPCKFSILRGYVFRQSNPAVVGVEIDVGKIRTGDPIMNDDGKRITNVKSMQQEQESINVATQGMQIAMAMDDVTFGRQIQEGDYLYTDIPEDDFKRLKLLKMNLSKNEVDILKEIAEIKRKKNPLWGVG